jgi:hypothetical protein
MPLDVFQNLINAMLPIYGKYARSHDCVAPGLGPPFELLTLRLDSLDQPDFNFSPEVPAIEDSVNLAGTKDDMRFLNSGDAYRANYEVAMRRGLGMSQDPESWQTFTQFYCEDLLGQYPIGDIAQNIDLMSGLTYLVRGFGLELGYMQ